MRSRGAGPRSTRRGDHFFDTADVYGWRGDGGRGEGITEQILGRWFRQGDGRRERVVLATKVYGDADMGADPADVALAWLLANPVGTAPIIGPRSVAQLDGAVTALDVSMSPEVLASPRPGRPGPRGMAW